MPELRGTIRRVSRYTVIGVWACSLCSSARAGGLTLTAAGQAQGLRLTTFATGFPSLPVGNGNQGPLGIAFTSGGGVLVSDKPGNVRLFSSDTDGQNAANAPVGQNYGSTNALDLAQIGANIYMTRYFKGDVVQINNDGTFRQVIVTGLSTPLGMAADAANGHLYANNFLNNTIYDIDPIAKTKSVFVNASADGVSISPDSKTLYAALTNGHIAGFDIATRKQIFDSGPIPGGVDGTAAGAGPIFSNYVFANTNSGQVYEVNLTTLSQTLIATGGSRGDFVTVDTTNDTLLLTQTDSIVRLSGASFTIPEPASLMMAMTAAVTGLGCWVARRGRATI